MTTNTASHWASLVEQGIAQGLLPESARHDPPPPEGRPWPVVVLTFLGAQLAVLPLVLFAVLLIGDALLEGPAPYGIALLLLTLGVTLLRQEQRRLFVEHLALIALLCGQGLLVFGWVRDLDTGPGGLLATVLTLALASAPGLGWVRPLLGAGAAALCYVACSELFSLRNEAFWLPPVPTGMAALWLLAQGLQPRLGRGRWAGVLEATATGWLVLTLAALALSSGMAMLAGGLLSTGAPLLRLSPLNATVLAQVAISMAAVLAAGVWSARRWTALRTPLWAGVVGVTAVLSAFQPALGPVAVVIAVTALTKRPWQACAAGLAAAWIVGAFYYQLDWDLTAKALVLAIAGCVLAALSAWSRRTAGRTARQAPTRLMVASGTPGRAGQAWMIALGALATLGVVNVGIWQKERLISQGRVLYVELAPVDPRSLLQGDYMALAYAMQPRLQEQLQQAGRLRRLQAVARIDHRGVATLERLLEPGETLDAHALPIELVSRGPNWVVASNGWFFREGDGARWSVARYGEFRVGAHGQALLVGLADEALQPIRR